MKMYNLSYESSLYKKQEKKKTAFLQIPKPPVPISKGC